MKLKLFTVYLDENGAPHIEVNEEVINNYGMSLEQFQEKVNTDNLLQGIEDFCEPLK